MACYIVPYPVVFFSMRCESPGFDLSRFDFSLESLSFYHFTGIESDTSSSTQYFWNFLLPSIPAIDFILNRTLIAWVVLCTSQVLIPSNEIHTVILFEGLMGFLIWTCLWLIEVGSGRSECIRSSLPYPYIWDVEGLRQYTITHSCVNTIIYNVEPAQAELSVFIS